MVLYILKWDVLPGKEEAYANWVSGAMKRVLAVPGVVEFRAYRPVTGKSEVAAAYEFADLAAWAAWYTNEECQKALEELRSYATSIVAEIWGPSPLVPKPVRPGV